MPILNDEVDICEVERQWSDISDIPLLPEVTEVTPFNHDNLQSTNISTNQPSLRESLEIISELKERKFRKTWEINSSSTAIGFFRSRYKGLVTITLIFVIYY